MHISKVHLYATDYPGDVRPLYELIASGEIDVGDIEGVMITHEGDLTANAFAMYEVARVLAEARGVSRDQLVDTLPIQALAGACGFMTPHTAVFTRKHADGTQARSGKRFAVAGACTRRFTPEEIGTMDYIEEVASTVQSLIKKADIESPSDVHLVFAKAPWPNPELYRAKGQAHSLVSDNWWTAGGYARGGAALGIGLALGEFNRSDLRPDRILHDDTLYSTIAQCSSTEDRTSVALIVFGNSPESRSDLVIRHGIMRDGLDSETVRRVLDDVAGTDAPASLEATPVRYAWIKPKTAEAGVIRGQRHTLMTHATLGPFWWMVEKAPVHATVAAVLGTPILEVATGPEHQGPPGQPLLAVLGVAG